MKSAAPSRSARSVTSAPRVVNVLAITTRRLEVGAQQQRQRLHAVHLGHLDVQHGHVDRLLLQLGQRLPPVGDAGDDVPDTLGSPSSIRADSAANDGGRSSQIITRATSEGAGTGRTARLTASRPE